MNINLHITTTTLDPIGSTISGLHGKDVVEKLSADLTQFSPMRFVGMTYMGEAGDLNSGGTFTFDAHFMVPDHTKTDIIPTWLRDKLNGLLHGYATTNIEIHNPSKEDIPMNTISKFSGTYGFLSNFFNVPVWGYKSVEHAFQAMKTRDPKKRELFKDVNMTPGQAKRKGRALVLREDWEDIKDQVMMAALREKFNPDTHANLHKRLMDTGDALLIEGNTWHDNYWGDCSCGKNDKCKAPGDNKLGKLLMELREEFRADAPIVREKAHIIIPEQPEPNYEMPDLTNATVTQTGPNTYSIKVQEEPMEEYINPTLAERLIRQQMERDYHIESRLEEPGNTFDEIEDQVEARREVYGVYNEVEVYAVPEVMPEDNHDPKKFFINSEDIYRQEMRFRENLRDGIDAGDIHLVQGVSFEDYIDDEMEAWMIEQVNEHISNNPSKEDTMDKPSETNMTKSLLPPAAVLTNPGVDGTHFVVSFRPNAEAEWDVELDNVPTLIRAMRYISTAKISSGEFKVESVIGDTTYNIEINHTKEDMVYEYKLEADWTSWMGVRITTNIHNPEEQFAIKVYNDLLGTRQKIQYEGEERPRIISMDQEATFEQQLIRTADFNTEQAGAPRNGIKVTPMFVSENWRYAFLQERIINIGGQFRIITMGKKTIAKMDTDPEIVTTVDDLINQSSFAYSEGDNLTIMYVLNHAGQQIHWSEFEEYVGIRLSMYVDGKPSSKLGKRMKEAMRYTLYADHMTKPLDILGAEFDEMLEIAVDGIAVTSESCFMRMVANIPDPTVRSHSYRAVKNGEIVRYSLRYEFGDGLFKGDGIIVKDDVLAKAYPEYVEAWGKVPDMIQPMINGEFVNLKKEFATDGTWAMHTATPHHGSNQPMTNDQMLSIFMNNPTEPWMFPKEQLKKDHLAFVNEVFNDIKAGIFPHYMRSDWMSSETGEMKMDPDRLALRMQQLSVRWTFSGRNLMESGHFIFMNSNGFWNRLNKSTSEDKKKRKIVIPIAHAAYVHVTSLSIIEMAGYDPAAEGYDTTKCFYYEQAHSWVKPDAVFIHDFERHGGEDGDDSEIVMIRKTYDEDKGETPETAVMRAISVRMPCAWGEFSINEVDDSGFPYYNTWNEMPTVNITKGVRPEFVEEMKEQQIVHGLPYSDVDVPEEYTKGWAQYMAKLIILNPGVGRIINPMIAWYTVAHTFFPEQLDNTEAFVDCLKQTPNEGAFIAINGEIDRMLRMIAESGGVIDDHIWETRIKGLELGKDSGTTNAAPGTTFFSEMWQFTKAVADSWRTNSKLLAANRQEIPVKAALKEMAEREVNPVRMPEYITIWDGGEFKQVVLKQFVKDLLNDWNNKQSRFGLFPEKSEARRHFSGQLCRDTVQYLDNQPTKARNWIMVQMYLEIWSRKNKKDIFLFQTPLNSGDISTMDLFLEALYQLGLAAKVDYSDFSRSYKFVTGERVIPTRTVEQIAAESQEGANGVY